MVGSDSGANGCPADSALIRQVKQYVRDWFLGKVIKVADRRVLLGEQPPVPAHGARGYIIGGQSKARRADRDLAWGMWRQIADSWRHRDRTVALALGERHDTMNELHASLIPELASGRMTLPVAMEMALVAHFCERLGDHAVNAARPVV